MKNLISIILVILVTGFSFSQTITFDKEFDFTIGQVEQIPEGDYIIAGSAFEGNVVARLDKSGVIKWIKIIENTLANSCSLLTLSDVFYISTNILESNNINSDARLIKMDYDGNILFEKNYGTPFTDEFGYQTIEADAGNYFFLTDTLFIKLIRQGDIIWEKPTSDISYAAVGGLVNRIIKFSDSQYLIPDNRYLISINENADSLWVREFPASLYIPRCC